MTYLIRFDNETGSFWAHSSALPSIRGEGKSLYAAVDDLERNLSRAETVQANRYNVNLEFQEKRKDQIELTARLSITV